VTVSSTNLQNDQDSLKPRLLSVHMKRPPKECLFVMLDKEQFLESENVAMYRKKTLNRIYLDQNRVYFIDILFSGGKTSWQLK